MHENWTTEHEDWCRDGVEGSDFDLTPTHWMPLPPPPSLLEEKGG
jgi:hypothetical protein